jgi:hypothetical protein
MNTSKLGAENMEQIQTACLMLVVVVLIFLCMKQKKTSEKATNLPSPALGLGTSNVMGFYQSFDQLWGSGSSSYSAPDSDYRQIMHQYAPSDPAYQELQY